MGLIDYGRIAGRAALVRQRCGFFDAEPPYSTLKVHKVCFPHVHVTGARLPKGVLETVEAGIGRPALYYNRSEPESAQRVGILHGFHHLLTDLRHPTDRDMRECNRGLRELEHAGKERAHPVEIGCDYFAGEVAVPFDKLDEYAPELLFPPDLAALNAWEDELTRLASRFHVPQWFMEWRLHDLARLRETDLNVR